MAQQITDFQQNQFKFHIYILISQFISCIAAKHYNVSLFSSISCNTCSDCQPKFVFAIYRLYPDWFLIIWTDRKYIVVRFLKTGSKPHLKVVWNSIAFRLVQMCLGLDAFKNGFFHFFFFFLHLSQHNKQQPHKILKRLKCVMSGHSNLILSLANNNGNNFKNWKLNECRVVQRAKHCHFD